MTKLPPTSISGTDRYFTQATIARRVVAWANPFANPRTIEILEPSAGGGAFVDAMLEYADSQNGQVKITAVEIDTVLAARLERKYANEPRVQIVCHDFLQMRVRPGTAKRFDLALMNPPYGSRADGTVGLDAVHVRHALRFAERAVGLLVTGFEHGVKRARELFDHAYVSRRVVLVKRPAFAGPEDKGESARRDHVVLEFKEGGQSPGTILVPTERWELDKDGEPRLIHERERMEPKE